MEGRISRALFIGGFLSLLFAGFMGKERAASLIRPPGALDETMFLAMCLRCGKCAQVCPQQAIKMGQGDKGISLGTPYIEPRTTACDLCMECVEVCTSGALRLIDKENVQMGLAEIDQQRCLAWQGDECKLCYTGCPFYNRGITLIDHKQPVVDPAICVGCGHCEHICIADPAAITVKARG